MSEERVSRVRWIVLLTLAALTIAGGTIAGIIIAGTKGHPAVKKVGLVASSLAHPGTPTQTNPRGSKSGFFPAATWKAISDHFGIHELHLQGTTWILTMTGQLRSSSDPHIQVPASVGEYGLPGQIIAPGGSGIAIEHCPASDTRCLSPTSPHSLSSFEFYWAPSPWIPFSINGISPPLSKPTPDNVWAIMGGGGFVFFDTDTNMWYPITGVSSVLAGQPPSAPPYPVRAAPLTKALTMPPPTPNFSAITHFPGEPPGWRPPPGHPPVPRPTH